MYFLCFNCSENHWVCSKGTAFFTEECLGFRKKSSVFYVKDKITFLHVRPVYTWDFLCHFWRTFKCNFCRARSRDVGRRCKLAAISVRFRRGIAEISNVMHFGDLWEIVANIAPKSHRNRHKLTFSINFALESATKISSKIAWHCVKCPLYF